MAEARASLILEVIRNDYQSVVEAAGKATLDLVAAQGQVIAQAPKLKEAKAAEATATKAHVDIQKMVEKAYYSALTPAEKTEQKIRDLKVARESLDATTEEGITTLAKLDAALIKNTQKYEDQFRRQEMNRGSQHGLSRSLAELLDEQTKAQAAAIAAGAALLREGQTAEQTAAALAHLKATTDEADKSSASYTADVARLEEQLKQLNQATDAQRASMSKVESVLSGLPGPAGQAGNSMKMVSDGLKSTAGQALLVVSATAAVGGAMLSMAADATENTDKIVKLAEVTGLSAEQLSRYQQLAEKSLPSGGIEKFAEGFQKLSSPAAVKALEEIGIATTDNAERLEQLAAWYTETGNTSERASQLTSIFGDGLAREMAPALAQGAAGIEKLVAQNDAFGRSIDVTAIAITGKYKDAQQELSGSVKGLGQEFITLTPILTATYDVMRGGVEAITATVRGVKAAADGIGFFASVLGTWAGTAKTWNEAADEVAAGLQADADAADRGKAAAEALTPAIEAVTQAHKDSSDAARDAAKQEARLAAAREAAYERRVEGATAIAIAEASASSTAAAAFTDSYDLRLDILEGFEDEVMASIDRVATADEAAMRQRMQAEAQLAKARLGVLEQGAAAAVGIINLVGGETDKAARAAFLVTQGAAAASAIVNTFVGITSALAAPPGVPMAVRVANAVAIGLAGAASVAGILATTFGSTGAGFASATSAAGGGAGSASGATVRGYESMAATGQGGGGMAGQTGSEAPTDQGTAPPRKGDDSLPVTDAFLPASMGRRTIELAPGDEADIRRSTPLGRSAGADPSMRRALEAMVVAQQQTNVLLQALLDKMSVQSYQMAIAGPAGRR